MFSSALQKDQQEDNDSWDNEQEDSSEALHNFRSFLQSKGVSEDSIDRLICRLTKIAAKDTMKNKNRLFFKTLFEITTILFEALKEVKDNVMTEVLKKIPVLYTLQVPLAKIFFSEVVANFVEKLDQESVTAENLELKLLIQAYKTTVDLFQRAFTRKHRFYKPVTLSAEILNEFTALDRTDKLFLLSCIELLGSSFSLTKKQLKSSGLRLLNLEAKSLFSWDGLRKYWVGGDGFFFKERRDGSVRIIRLTYDSHKNKFHDDKDNILGIAGGFSRIRFDDKKSKPSMTSLRKSSFDEEQKHDHAFEAVTFSQKRTGKVSRCVRFANPIELTSGNHYGFVAEPPSPKEYQQAPEVDGLDKYTINNNYDPDLHQEDYTEIFGSQHSNCSHKKVSCLDDCWV